VPELTHELVELAEAYGVATSYHDWQGRPTQVSSETITAVLAAMEVDASSADAARRALRERREARWRRMLPACVVAEHGIPKRFWVHVPHGDPVQVWVETEAGDRRDLSQIDHWVEPHHLDDGPDASLERRLVGEATFAAPPDLPLGYHEVHARSGETEARCALIVTPPYLGVPEALADHRAWGLATQLYSVRSSRSWGVGDLVDLTDLAVWSGATLGADYVLVNPMHAGEPVAPMEPSPYLPTSRRFFNPLYLRPERIPEYVDLPRAEQAKVTRRFKAVRRKLDALDGIDRDTSWTAKREALQLVHAVERTAGREADYRAFREREGEGLSEFATWCAIAERHGNDFHGWPAELQDPHSEAVDAFRAAHPGAIDFHSWLQWVLDEQLQAAQAKATGAGMALGVMHDLAVGVHPGGADAWRQQDTYAQGIGVGAPADGYNQMGQDWSQPPWRPDRLAEHGYAPFRSLLASVLRHSGGVRVDHVIGLFRLWWVPAGQRPSEGTYVRYDHEALIGILALEAHRAGAVVVGEDLGTVEPMARDYLRRRGILGTSILWFERDEEGRPLPAERWRELCMASVTTHDLPPTAGYLEGAHLELRNRLGVLARSYEEEKAADEADRASWLAEVRSRGLLPDDAGAQPDEGPSVEKTVQALHRYLGLTPSRLLCVALVDLVGDKRIQNQPGTSDEYPNWRVPLSGPDGKPLLLEDVLGSGPRVQLAPCLARRANPSG
jgi:4-alpha-glucanotransferase